MNLSKRVEVTSLDSINGRLIQMLLRLGILKLLYSPDLKNGTLFFVTKVFHKGLQCFTLTWDSMSCNGWWQGFMVAWVCTANPSPQKKLPFGDSCLYYSTGHGHCSIFTRVNCAQYGGLHAKNTYVKFYMNNYMPLKFHTSCVYFFNGRSKRIRCWSITVFSHLNFSRN